MTRPDFCLPDLLTRLRAPEAVNAADSSIAPNDNTVVPGTPAPPSGSYPTDAGHPSTPSTDTERCPCGYGIGDLMVSADKQYTGFGWFLITLVGITAQPTAIGYRCRRCNHRFARVDPPPGRKGVAT